MNESELAVEDQYLYEQYLYEQYCLEVSTKNLKDAKEEAK